MSKFKLLSRYFSIISIVSIVSVISVHGAHESLDMLQDNTDGDVGLYVKRINGPVGVDYRSTATFEPASAIKVLIHVHAMLQVQNNPSYNFFTSVPWMGDITKYDGMGVYNPGGSDCPTNNTVVESDNLKQALRWMMENSDNALTQALRDLFTDVAINGTRVFLNMNGTALNHTIGCGNDAVADHNELTLVDVGKLHEAVANGLLNPIMRQDFYELMLNQSAPENFDDIVNEEAAKQGKMLYADDFRNLISFAYKGGSYTLADGEYRSIAGYIRIPFSNGSSFREYVFGVFVDGASTLDAMNTGEDLSVGAVASEMLRDIVKGALWTWKTGGIKAPDFESGILKLQAYLLDTSPSPLYYQIDSAIVSLEQASRELDRSFPDLLRVMHYLREGVNSFDYAVAAGMLDLERGHRESKMIVALARERAKNRIALAYALGNHRDMLSVLTMADNAMELGDRSATSPMSSFPANFYDALGSYEYAIELADSTLADPRKGKSPTSSY